MWVLLVGYILKYIYTDCLPSVYLYDIITFRNKVLIFVWAKEKRKHFQFSRPAQVIPSHFELLSTDPMDQLVWNENKLLLWRSRQEAPLY